MNDTLPPPLPPAPPATPAPPALAHEPRPVDPARPSRPAAAWLAIAGSGLLLLAAVVVVASRWQLIPPTVRFSGLLAAAVLIAAAAEQIRRSAPTTAAVVAHLVPGIAVTVGIAAGATLDHSWPVCVVIGGLLGVAVTEVQKRRWASPRMAVVAALGLILAAVGLATQVEVPAAVLAAGAACALLLCRRDLEAATLALVVGASPILATVTTLKVGDGTMARIGAAGSAVAWSAPVAGLLAAVVLGVMAHRRHSAALVGCAFGSLMLNVVAGLAVGAAAAPIWACVLAVLVIAIELGAALPAGGIWQELTSRVSARLARPVVLAGLVVPPVVVISWIFGLMLASWTLPLALAATATVIIGGRRFRSHPGLADIAAAATVGFSVTAAAAVGATSLTVSIVALAGLVLCFVFRSTSLPAAALSSAGYLAATLVQRSADADHWNHSGAHWTVPAAIDLGLLTIAALLAAAVLTRRPSTRPGSMMAIAGIAGVLAVIVSPDWQFTAATVVIALVGLFGTRRWPQLVVTVSVMTATAAMIQLGDGHWSGVLALVISAAIAFAGRGTSPLSFAWSPQLVVAGWIALQLAGTTPNGLVGWMMVVAITATGVAFTTPRLTALDSAALTATVLAGLSVVAAGVHPAFASLVLLVGSAQGIAYGIAQRRLAFAVGSAVVGTCALISLWFTSGTNAALLANLAQFDFTGADLTVIAIGAAMLLAGVGTRRWQSVSTWLAYGPGLALISAWIVAVQANRSADWAAITGLVVGITAIGVGGWRRLAAPLVIGSASLVTTVVIASGSQLASLPGWTWLVVGGVALLGLAAAIERHSADESDTTDCDTTDGATSHLNAAGANRDGGLKAILERFQ